MFKFSLDRVAMCAVDPEQSPGEAPAGAPEDFHLVVGTAGDQFRDWFTRLCLYLVLQDEYERESGETVIIGTEYGNFGAMAGLQRTAAAKGRLMSAQYFPNALTSSASAFVNLAIGATGRNMTLNAAQLTPVVTLWQVLAALGKGSSSTGHLLIGDVYSPEALGDARREDADLPCESGVTHARLSTGDAYSARFDFWQEDAASAGPFPASGRAWVVAPGEGVVQTAEPKEHLGRNGAFITAEFLRMLQGLGPGGSAVVECRATSGKRASVTVTKRSS
ncbi:hypothetical protein J7E96_08690 [Streptomyces sp. ISL-96]|uniref:hypothetical protein n=1 Tax=Streptomyces sp. ISL-96 TaxID=2819191 RepID=UPI001BE6AB97|nr:hypothetical protein [Streptomyces sp. ISL-96]MBT2488600.1 hypothetical protein [Streptomyces sp. ISL-96]